MANEQFGLVVHLELTDESKDLIRKKEEKAALAIKELHDAAQAAKFKVKVVKTRTQQLSEARIEDKRFDRF